MNLLIPSPILENEIVIVPQIFNEEKAKRLDNIMDLGDLSEKLSSYFNSYFGKGSLGTPLNIRKYNNQTFQYVIGGDPEYLEYCLKEIVGFKIDWLTKLELQKLEVNAFKGIKVIRQNKNSYSYNPVIDKFLFEFKK